MNSFNSLLKGSRTQFCDRYVVEHLFAEYPFLCNTSRQLLLLVASFYFEISSIEYRLPGKANLVRSDFFKTKEVIKELVIFEEIIFKHDCRVSSQSASSV